MHDVLCRTFKRKGQVMIQKALKNRHHVGGGALALKYCAWPLLCARSNCRTISGKLAGFQQCLNFVTDTMNARYNSSRHAVHLLQPSATLRARLPSRHFRGRTTPAMTCPIRPSLEWTPSTAAKPSATPMRSALPLHSCPMVDVRSSSPALCMTSYEHLCIYLVTCHR